MGDNPQTEVAYQAWDEQWQGWRKCLVDIVPQAGAFLADIKSTDIDLSQTWRMEREARDNGYLFQSSYCADLHAMVTGERIEHFVIAWINGPKGEYADERGNPWMCRLHVIPRISTSDNPCLTFQAAAIRDALDSLKAAYEADSWVAYEDEVLTF
jgi:hypothetical protein